MKQLLESITDYLEYLSSPETLTGLFLTSCLAAIFTIIMILG